MGGHGGLNILPQKRWNVYNRDNRLKVARDEAKAKQQEDEATQRAEQAEREHRHQVLLAKAHGPAAPSDETAGSLEHINFWKQEELQMQLQHPENVKQQKDELRKRGNPDTYTTDAKFDERFQLGHGMGGEKPWYAQAPKEPSFDVLLSPGDLATQPALPIPAQAKALPAASRKRRSLEVPSGDSSSSDDSSSSSGSSSSDSGQDRRRHSKGSRHRKHGHSSKHHKSTSLKEKRTLGKHAKSSSRDKQKSRRKDSSRGAEPDRPVFKSVEELRAERLQRERDEQAKAKLVLVGAYQLDQGVSKDYNSTYGFAAANKRQKTQRGAA